MSQEDKAYLNLAGEFLVAGELNRRRVAASITYGASKSADIFAFSPAKKRFARIEVKASDKGRWPVGARAFAKENEEEEVFWVLVHLPVEGQNPEYFVFTGKELTERAKKFHKDYTDSYREKHGKDYEGLGVPTLERKWVNEYRDRWDKIVGFLI
ncbi:MAG: hypothetical protein WCN98_12745 [Verrucomicrobiaceae bacterium]